MSIYKFITAIVGVTVGHIAVDGTINTTAQKVFIAIVCFYLPSRHPIQINVTSRCRQLITELPYRLCEALPRQLNHLTITGVKAANQGVKVFFIWGGTCVKCFDLHGLLHSRNERIVFGTD